MANKLDKVVGSVSGLSSNINEVIRSVLNFLFYFFSHKDFISTKMYIKMCITNI